MAITQQTVISQIEILRDGTVQLRLSKQVLNDDLIISEGYHRTTFPPGADFDEQMKVVNDHLVAMGNAPVEPLELARVLRVVKMEHSPEVVEAYAKKLAAALVEGTQPALEKAQTPAKVRLDALTPGQAQTPAKGARK